MPESSGGQGSPPPATFLPCSPARAQEAWREARDGQHQREQAEQALEEERRRVQEEGRREIEQARQQTCQEAAAIFREVAEELLAQIQQGFAQKMDEVEEELVSLSGEMVGQIIQQKVATDDSIVVGVVRAALAKVAGATRLEVKVNAADEEIVREAQQELVSVLEGIDSIQVVSSDEVGRGGAIISSDRGEVDARLSTQVDILLGYIAETADNGR